MATLNQILPIQNLAPTPLHNYVTEAPEKNFLHLKCKALAAKTLAAITGVAFLAIMAVVFSLYYSGIVLTGASSMWMMALILTSPFLSMLGTRLYNKSTEFSRRAEIEGQVALRLKELVEAANPEEEVRTFFRENGLDIERVPLPALQQVNPDRPLLALLPLIARFKLFQNLAILEERKAQQGPAALEQGFTQKEQETGKPIDELDKRNVRLNGRLQAWVIHEFEAIPKALEAALVLRIIQEPTLAGLALSNLGECKAKTFAERTLDRIHAPINDDYFVFHPYLHRAPLTLTEIEANMEPSVLLRKLYPTLYRA